MRVFKSSHLVARGSPLTSGFPFVSPTNLVHDPPILATRMRSYVLPQSDGR